jgi:flagellar protein FlbD
MISVTRLDGSLLVVNAELVVTVEKTPDTMIRLTTGDRFLVKESVDEVVAKVIAYRQRAHQPPPLTDSPNPAPDQEQED